jgi:hypothetical protein
METQAFTLDQPFQGGQVALGDCSPRAPTDPHVPALEHTAPHIMVSPCGHRPIGRCESVEADSDSASD